MAFELFVAQRYLRAKRKERFISIVTLISVVGVTVGVAALIVALAINNGIQQDLRDHLLSANAPVNLSEKEYLEGIADWRPFIAQLERVEGVVAAAPALYGEVMISTPLRARGCYLKGVDPAAEIEVADLLLDLEEGSLNDLISGEDGLPGIIIGRRLADAIGARLQTQVTVLNPQGEMNPLFGRLPGQKRFRVVGIFDSGFFEYDNAWTFTTLKAAQQALSIPDVINTVEFKVENLERADEVARRVEEKAGDEYAALSWMERNRNVFNALQMEKLVTAVAIGLIMLVAALNILISLVMMVMEKNRDIAIMKAMGAKASQIRRIFLWQGLLIGAVGAVGGLILGHSLCWLCDTYRLIPLEAEVYGISYVPFAPEALDGVWVALAAFAISYLTTLYPSTSAARVAPVESLRYE